MTAAAQTTRARRVCSEPGCDRPFYALDRCHMHWRRKRYREQHPNVVHRAGTPIDLFLERFEIDPISGCWLWTGTITSYGYGALKLEQVIHRAHRWSYEFFVGSIEPGLEVDHLCHDPNECNAGTACLHRRCVNPDHLRAVPPRLNNLRSNSRSGINARKTRCNNGHEFTPENTYIAPSGARRCRTCYRAWAARRREVEG